MQNKLFYHLLVAGLVTFGVSSVNAQEADDFVLPEEPVEAVVPEETATVAENVVETVKEPVADAPAPVVEAPVAEPVVETPTADVTPDLTGKTAVDFPSRSSLDTLEFAPLPDINYTNIPGPAPLAPSVSSKDLPSERLIGRLTPEVFQEMAELERDNTFLKLQIQKETMKNDLEKIKSNYRQARLDEIAKREDVVRTRIQWWQEQEKIRQDLEAQRAAAENLKSEAEEAKAVEQTTVPTDDIPANVVEATVEKETESVVEPKVKKVTYELVAIQGTRNDLSARIKNADTGRLITVRRGDTLPDGTYINDVSAAGVTLFNQEEESVLTFDEV